MKKFVIFLFNTLSWINIFSQPTDSSKSNLPVGIFDSGTGGLTILQAILTLDAYNNNTGEPIPDGQPDFTNEVYQYLADQANMPYGNYAAAGKTDLLKEHMLKNAAFFTDSFFDSSTGSTWKKAAKPPVKMIVLACNTATAYTLADLQKWLAHENKNIPCIGVIDAGAKAALMHHKKNEGTIGVFATAGTVASNGYPKALRLLARKNYQLDSLSIVSQGGVGLAESIDRDWDYYNDTSTTIRLNYKGPSFTNKNLYIDSALLFAYRFNASSNKLLCEYDAETNTCLDMQLNDPSNYVRYHLVSLLEKMKKEKSSKPLTTLILGCTHYPYMKDTIASVLQELYNLHNGTAFVYRNVLARDVALIDPAVETAKEAWQILYAKSLLATRKPIISNMFFITVPNTDLPEIMLQENGAFTYDYKYGRNSGENKKFVQTESFSTNNISAETYARFKQILPAVYTALQNFLPDLK